MQKNIAARMGRWSAQNRKKAIGGWLAFVIISFVIGGVLGVKAPEDEQTYVGDSGKAHQLVDQHFPTENVESVIVQARKGSSAQDPAVRAAVDDTIAAVKTPARRLRGRVPLRQGQREPGLQGRPLAARELQAAR